MSRSLETLLAFTKIEFCSGPGSTKIKVSNEEGVNEVLHGLSYLE